jgi:hypothetical protein
MGLGADRKIFLSVAIFVASLLHPAAEHCDAQLPNRHDNVTLDVNQ